MLREDLISLARAPRILGEEQQGPFSLSPPYKGLTIQLGLQKGLRIGRTLLNVWPAPSEAKAASEEQRRKGRSKDIGEQLTGLTWIQCVGLSGLEAFRFGRNLAVGI